MPPIPPIMSDDSAGRLRLRTILRLRWIAVAGQAGAVAFVYFGLGFELPVGWCALAIALSAWLNIYLRIRYDSRLWLRSRYASAMLGYDILQLTALLYLTGGLQNPFAFLLIAPVTISASKQPLEHTLFLALLVIGCISGLILYHLPLPWYPDEALELPVTYIAGIWVALVSGTLFFALYAQRIAKEARQMSDALAATEAVLLREQSMSALDGLAAAAAHELGTPLSTIAVVATELQRELPKDGSHAEDLALLKGQAERCREILAKLSAGAAETDMVFAHMPLTHLLEEVAEPHRVFDINIQIEAGPSPSANGRGTEEPMGIRSPGIIYGLGNIIENAADFASKSVDVQASWNEDKVFIRVIDDGPGFTGPIKDRLGEPYVTSRPAGNGFENGAEGDGHGMGLGFFIAKTLLERSGAHLDFSNREEPETGAIVEITWPRDLIEAGDEDRGNRPT